MTATTRLPLVARMLLRSGLLSLVSVMSACVLPIAPEFQDPPAEANFAPVILDGSDPPIGWVVTAPTPESIPTFTVFVSDPNLEDDLHVRWIADYPPNTANTRDMVPDFPVTHSSNGLPLDQPVSVTPSCSAHNLAKIPQHQIMVVVADGEFDNSPPPVGMPVDLTKLKDVDGRDDRKKVIATWTLNLECP